MKTKCMYNVFSSNCMKHLGDSQDSSDIRNRNCSTSKYRVKRMNKRKSSPNTLPRKLNPLHKLDPTEIARLTSEVAKGGPRNSLRMVEELQGVHESQLVEWRSVYERKTVLDKLQILEIRSHHETWKSVTKNIAFSHVSDSGIQLRFELSAAILGTYLKYDTLRWGC